MVVTELSRRSLVLLALSIPSEGPLRDTYVNVRKQAIRSAQVADSFDRWQKGVFEDITLGTPPPPDVSPLTLTPEAKAALCGAAMDAFRAVRPRASPVTFSRALEDSRAQCFRALSNSARRRVEEDVAGLSSGFDFECLYMWTYFREALSTPAEREAFNREMGARVANAFLPADDSRPSEVSPGVALASAISLLNALEAGGAVRGVSWDKTDLFADGVSDSFSFLLRRSAWLEASLSLQGGSQRFFPDFAGAAVAHTLASQAQLRTSHIEYYLDDTYRPEPGEYRPTQTLVEFSLVDDAS